MAHNTRFVYQWLNEGFFSELNNMLLGILYCRLTNRQFVLSTRYSPVFHQKGWRDFFEPFCPEIESRILHFMDSRSLPASMTPRALVKRLRRRLLTQVVLPIFYPDVDVMSTGWDAMHAFISKEKTFVLSVEGTRRHCSLREALHVLDREIWHYNTETAGAITASIAGLNLPRRYAAMHIRRGDMNAEATPISETRYVERLEQATSLQDVYVATDDYRCGETIQRLRPSWRVSFLCPKGMRGYFWEDFDNQPPEERGRRTLLLLTETEIMRGADVFVGTFSSGIGTYQGIARDHHTYAVDAERWSFEGGQ